MARTAVGYFRDRAAADAAYDALLECGFAPDDISVVGHGEGVGAGLGEEAARYYDTRLREGGVLLAVRADDARYGAAQAILLEHGGDVHGEGSSGPADVPQSAGASRGAPGFPDPRPRVGDDAGLIGTPVTSTSGATDTLDRPGAALDPRRSTPPTEDVRPPAEPAAPRRSHGPPII